MCHWSDYLVDYKLARNHVIIASQVNKQLTISLNNYFNPSQQIAKILQSLRIQTFSSVN